MEITRTCPVETDWPFLAYLFWPHHDMDTAPIDANLITPCVLQADHPGSHVAFDGARHVEWDDADRALRA
jgi:hypothetical protein